MSPNDLIADNLLLALDLVAEWQLEKVKEQKVWSGWQEHADFQEERRQSIVTEMAEYKAFYAAEPGYGHSDSNLAEDSEQDDMGTSGYETVHKDNSEEEDEQLRAFRMCFWSEAQFEFELPLDANLDNGFKMPRGTTKSEIEWSDGAYSLVTWAYRNTQISHMECCSGDVVSLVECRIVNMDGVSLHTLGIPDSIVSDTRSTETHQFHLITIPHWTSP